jgi:hypothetical protein
LIIRETKNVNEIKSVLCHPSIYPEISDGVDLKSDDIEIPFDGVVYLAGYDNEVIGISCLHFFKDGLKLHPNVLPEYRLKYGRDFVRLCISMVNCPLYVEIPNRRKRLLNLANKLGFDSLRNNSTKTLMKLRC